MKNDCEYLFTWVLYERYRCPTRTYLTIGMPPEQAWTERLGPDFVQPTGLEAGPVAHFASPNSFSCSFPLIYYFLNKKGIFVNRSGLWYGPQRETF